MTRRAARFKAGDVTRMLRAVGKAGERIERVEVDAVGKIAVVIGQPDGAESDHKSEWDEVLHRGKH
jgi:hypothetical protein